MSGMQETTISCPYCGEVIDVLVDASIARQNYIEDCQVCCRPIIFDVTIDHDGGHQIQVSSEDE
jgi:hypothetical protein